MTYPFKLIEGSKKLPCPECGQKTFVPYVFSNTQEIVDGTKYGRCDRISKCGHLAYPKGNHYIVTTPSLSVTQPAPKTEIKQIYPGEDVVSPITDRTRTCVSPFHKYCQTVGIPLDHLLKWGVYSDGANGEKTAFLFKNRDGKVVNIKWFKYLANGHRDKEFNAHSLKQPKKVSQNGKDKNIEEKYLLCLFGEHLLDPERKKEVCLVESEKTAVIASFFYPQFDWVSCGSAHGLGVPEGLPGDFKIKALYNRKVIWLADADKAGRDNKSIKLLKKYGIDHYVLDLYPDRNDGYDVADDLAKNITPEIKFIEEKKDKDFHHIIQLPDGCKYENVRDDIKKYRSFQYSNRIYMVRWDNKESHYYSQHITNFSIESLGHIESTENPRRLIRITNVHGLSKELEVPTKAFASNTEFTVFVESEGNFQYNGNTQDLKCIRARLYDSMTSFREIDTLGWQNGMFFFANGIWNDGKFRNADKYGFVKVEQNNSYFIPALSTVNKHAEEDWEDERKFVYVKRKVTLKEWARLFCKVHGENGIIAIAWFFASLFRDTIYRNFKFFPHLFLFGPKGTGKSQVGWSIRAMGFNAIKKPFLLNAGTKVSFHREFIHFINFPCWFDEYNNSIDFERIQSLKGAYDGAGHKKSVKDSDKRTKSTPVNSGCMISGQELPVADIALFTRVVLLQFAKTEFTQEEKKALRDLQNLEEGGLSNITAAMMTFRQIFEEKFMDTFDQVLQEFLDDHREDVEDRIIRNMCIIATTIKLVEPKTGKDLPFSYEQFKGLALSFVSEQMSLINRSAETNVFWDMLQYLIEQKLIVEEKDFNFLSSVTVTVMTDRNATEQRNLGKWTTILYLRVTRIIPLYQEHFKRQNSSTSSAMDKNSLLHYLKHQKYYIGYCKARRFTHEGIGSTYSAYMFNYDLMKKMGIEILTAEQEENIKKDSNHEGNQTQVAFANHEIDDLPF